MDAKQDPDSDGLTARLARCYTGVDYDILRGRGVVERVLPASIVPLDRAMARPAILSGVDPRQADLDHGKFQGVRGRQLP